MAGHANKFLMLVGTTVILIFNPKRIVTSFPSVAKSRPCAAAQGHPLTQACPFSLAQPSCLVLSPPAASRSLSKLLPSLSCPGPGAAALLPQLEPLLSICCQSLPCQGCCSQQCQSNKEQTSSLMLASSCGEAGPQWLFQVF